MRISDWSSDVCSSDLHLRPRPAHRLDQGEDARFSLMIAVGETNRSGYPGERRSVGRTTVSTSPSGFQTFSTTAPRPLSVAFSSLLPQPALSGAPVTGGHPPPTHLRRRSSTCRSRLITTPHSTNN